MNQKRLIALLIVIGVIITSFSIRGTYAKYKSSIDLTDKTRVATWDINTTQIVDLFKDSYSLNGVESLNGAKIIAPGTSGTYTFKIAGTAETSYRLNFDVETEDTIGRLKYYLVDGIDEYPYDNLDELMNDIAMNLFPIETYEPGTETDMEYTIRWEWPAIDSDEEDSKLINQVVLDPKDPNYKNQPHVKLTVKISAEQKTN